ncbi:MAG: pyrroline-5-carboxylate reductase [Clostridia bacterium]|nr:pyrroline-5-carboxylate reductase [Clostridia bacterium]
MTGFIGAGNMANAIIKGMLASEAVNGADIMIYDIDSKKVKTVCKLYGCCEALTAVEVAEKCSEIVLAVKPYDFEKLLSELDSTLKQHNPLIISIAAGNTTDYITSLLSYTPTLARVMPNINATIGEAMSAYCTNERVTDEQKAFVETLCASIGEVTELEEKHFSAFCAVAGSAPAFVYMFIDELARAGVKLGINKKVALKVATQTVLGSAKMVAESGEHPYELIDKVCSPGGTTIEGIAALNENGLPNAVMQAVTAAYEKDKKLSEKK